MISIIEINFYDKVEDNLVTFVDIISKYHGKWVLCKHKERSTYEWLGGHREDKESIEDAARRELWEETGATLFSLLPICIYGVIGKDGPVECEKEMYGAIYYAEIKELDSLPDYEMEKIELFEELCIDWTYPSTHPLFIEKVTEMIAEKQIQVASEELREKD